MSPTNLQTGHTSLHFRPQPRFFPRSQRYSRLHSSRKSASFPKQSPLVCDKLVCLFPHPCPRLQRAGSPKQVLGSLVPWYRPRPSLQSTGAEADRCLLRARLEARAPSYPPFAKRPTRVTQTLIIPFLLLLTARYDLRRASPTSARAMERKRWTKSKNRKHSARHQETRAGRRKDFQPGSRFAHHHSPRTSSLGTRGGADSAEVSGAAPRAPPRKFEALPPSRRLRERPRSPRTRGQAVRTVPYLPERRGHVATLPAARQTTTVGGDTRPGSPRPAPPNRTAPPAPAATDRVKHGCPSLDASAAPRPFYIHASGQI